MNQSVTRPRPSAAARRFGYVMAALVNAVILYLVNAWPGWQRVPFLTDATPSVLGLVNATLIASIVVNLVYLGWDPPRVRAAGDIVTTALGLASTIRIWRVFPFDFSGYSFNWGLLVRILLVIGIVGSIIGLIVRFVALLRDRP